MLRNWAIHAKKIGLPYTVACMDDALFTLADKCATPAYQACMHTDAVVQCVALHRHEIPGVMMVETDSTGEKEVRLSS